jgi:hypothetical protein
MIQDFAIENFCRLNPELYGFLETFELHRKVESEGSSDFSIVILLRRSDFAANRLMLTFEGVRGVKINYLEGLVSLAVSVNSIRDDQQEGLNYRVTEVEEEAFSFFCASFRASILVTL